ncbi:hypothetical protein GGQ84_000874 [Desulfitispora alkaliphila]|uniref:copper amine oxidase N-terminal domain-containing protein n=1 Tax=Desulfitispora alkaliphila TaxID=622674 RepID=UPI003D19BF21
MKKFLSGIIVGVLIASSGIVIAQENIKLIVNRQEVRTDVAPQMIDGRVMVPVRFVSEALGANVTWDGERNTVQISTTPPELYISEWLNLDKLEGYAIFVAQGPRLMTLTKGEQEVTFTFPFLREGEQREVRTDKGTLRIKKEDYNMYFHVKDLKELGF